MPTINIPIFEGGRNEANLRAARAVYRQAGASYRNVVLGAYRNVVGDPITRVELSPHLSVRSADCAPLRA